MYNDIKRLSLFCGILAFFNIFSVIMFFLIFLNSTLNFNLVLTILIFLVTVCAFILLMTIGIHRMCETLEVDYEVNVQKFQEMSNKVDLLEEKCK